MSEPLRELPIGIFDSGMGGLTVLKALRALLPDESFIYLGDTARLPYGAKSPETVIRYALQASAKLVQRGVKLLVVACNTVSAVALPDLSRAFAPLPVLGVVEPGAQAACATSSTGNIAVIATESTIRGKAYERAILRLRPQALVRGKACPLFVAMAEDGLVAGPLAQGLIARYLDEIFSGPDSEANPRPDCLVLGCTHYPVLRQAIGAVLGPEVKLVDSAESTALAVRDLLETQKLRKHGPATSKYLTTDDAQRFARYGELFLGEPLAAGQVELVDL